MLRKLEFYEEQLQDQLRQYSEKIKVGDIRSANYILDTNIRSLLFLHRMALFTKGNVVPQTVHLCIRSNDKIRVAAYLEGSSKLNF
jgi:hypothetical protein